MVPNAAFQWVLDDARKERMCMVPYCGTCGANPFMRCIQRALGLKALVPVNIFFLESKYRDLLFEQLALLNSDQAELNFEAIKLFLTYAFNANSLDVTLDIEEKLAGTPTGFVLLRMRKHYDDVLAKRALSDQVLAKTRREEKKKAREQMHIKRKQYYQDNPFISISRR
jgi:hypothetical protein